MALVHYQTLLLLVALLLPQMKPQEYNAGYLVSIKEDNMSETRYIKEYTNGVLTAELPYEVSDEELAEEAERKAMERAEELIDAIGNLTDAKVFLKRLVRRLIKNGALP